MPLCRFSRAGVAHLLVLVPVLFAGSSHSRETETTLAPRFTDSESYTQVYTATALCGDSLMVQTQFALTNLGLGDRNAACKILLLTGPGKPRVWNHKYGHDRWHYTADSENFALSVGPNSIAAGNGNTRIVAGDSKLRAEIRFFALPDPVVPPDAKINAKGRFFEYVVALRWMDARVTVTQAGGPAKELNGYAMLEMSRSTSLPSDICRGWLTFRGYDSGAAFNASIRLPTKEGSASTGWTWQSNLGQPTSITGLLLDVVTPKGHFRKPQLRAVVAPDGSFTIASQELLGRYSFIDELGPVLGGIVKLVVGAPVVYFYRAQVQLPSASTAMPGILEYMRLE